MQTSAASLTSARRPLAGQQAGPRPGRVAAARPPLVRCAAGKQEANDPKMEGLRDKAAVFLTGLAATCLALNPAGAAHAEGAAAPAAPPKPTSLETELQAVLKERAVTLQKLEASPQVTAQESAAERADAIKAQSKLEGELASQNAKVKKLTTDLEAALTAMTKTQKDIQDQLAKEVAETKKLQADIKAAKAAGGATNPELQEKLEKEIAQVKKLKADLDEAKAKLDSERKLLAEAREQSRAAQRQAEQLEVQRLLLDLEKNKADAFRSVEGLQKRLASEHTEVQRLRSELEKSKKDVDNEKKLLIVAQKQAAEAAAAARAAAAEKAKASMAKFDLETLQNVANTPVGLGLGAVAVAGWGVAGAIAAARKQDDAMGVEVEREAQRVFEQMQGAYADVKAAKERMQGASNEVLAAREQFRTEKESLRREIVKLQTELAKINAQLDQERGQSNLLRERVVFLEEEYARVEGGMYAAKSEAFELQRRLDEVLVEPTSKMSAPKAAPPPAPKPLQKEFSRSAPSAASPNGSQAVSNGKAVRVKFVIKQELPFGQSLILVGSHPALGGWDETKGPRMTWGDGHVWTAEVGFTPGTAMEFKCVRMIEGAGSQWEDGPNHKLLVPSDGTGSMDVRVEWGSSATVTSTMASKRPGSEPMPKLSSANGKQMANIVSTSSSSTVSSTSGGGGSSNKWKGLLG